MLNKNKWIYVAAMIDAEGCISIGAANHKTLAGNPYKAYMLRIQIANTSKVLMNWILENFGGVIYIKKIPKNQKSKKQVHQWFTKGGWKAQEKFLLGILPYLIIKREQALVALDFIHSQREQNPEKRFDLWNKCRALNSGESVTTNTLNNSPSDGAILTDGTFSRLLKIESELVGDNKSGPVVTQESQ